MIKRYIFVLLLSFNFIALPISANTTINAGTTIKTRMAEPIDSRVRKVGYKFKMTIDSTIEKEGKILIKSGSNAQAMITHIQKSSRTAEAPEIIITLTKVTIGNRQRDVNSFQVAGKGENNKRKEVGEIDENEHIVINQQGEKLTASIPVMTKGYNLILTQGTVVYFILKEPITL